MGLYVVFYPYPWLWRDLKAKTWGIQPDKRSPRTNSMQRTLPCRPPIATVQWRQRNGPSTRTGQISGCRWLACRAIVPPQCRFYNWQQYHDSMNQPGFGFFIICLNKLLACCLKQQLTAEMGDGDLGVDVPSMWCSPCHICTIPIDAHILWLGFTPSGPSDPKAGDLGKSSHAIPLVCSILKRPPQVVEEL